MMSPTDLVLVMSGFVILVLWWLVKGEDDDDF